nr:ALPV-172 [Albatrosspox virus]
MNQEINKYILDYNVFFSNYEPKAVSCSNNLKEILVSHGRLE